MYKRQALKKAISDAYKANILMVAAAGNNGPVSYTHLSGEKKTRVEGKEKVKRINKEKKSGV